MTTSLKDLIKQRESLDQQIILARKNEVSHALAKVHELVAEFGLTAHDVFPSGKKTNASGGKRSTGTSGKKVAPKYRNPITGGTWTGRGKAPKWIEGKDRTAFAIVT